jgi:hypothetical protein
MSPETTMSNKCRSFVATLAFFMAAPAIPAYTGLVARDPSFGANGVAPAPLRGADPPGVRTLGFVRLPQSGEYIYLSAQQINGNPRVVASRLTAAGTVNHQWGDQGSLVYSMPDPYNTWVLVNLEGSPAQEFVYVVGNYGNSLAVGRISVATGSFTFSTSSLPNAFTNGIGGITAVATAAPTTLYATNSGGVLVAVRGTGAEANKTELVQAYDITTTIDIVEYPYTGAIFTGPGLGINYMAQRDDGKFDVVGSAGGKATYLQYNAVSPGGQLNYIDLACANSVADGLVRDASLAGDVLLIGRSSCGPEVARIQTIETVPQRMWSANTGYNGVLNGCNNLTASCADVFAAMSVGAPAQVQAVTAEHRLVRVDTNSGQVVGADWLYGQVPGGLFQIYPSYRTGTALVGPHLMAVGKNSSAHGLGRVAADRLFAGSMEQ